MKPQINIKGWGLLIVALALILFVSIGQTYGFWSAVGLLAIGGIVLTYSAISQIITSIHKPALRLYAKDFALKLLAKFMGIFLIVGTLIYFYVFYTIGHDDAIKSELGHPAQFTNAEYLFRSLICSLDLFMLDVDSNILDRLDSQGALKGWMAFLSVLSFSCTVAMLVGLVYSRLHAYYKLHYDTKISDAKNHLYLFFGHNEPSELLIKDIITNDSKALAIIIDEANVKDADTDQWEGIVGLVTHNRKVFRTAEKIGAQVAIASQPLYDIDDDVANREDFDAFGYLGLSKIKKFIQRLSKTSSPQLHIFFMADDEELNIRNIIALAKDNTIKDVAANIDLYHRIYCHARYNGPNRVIQDVALKKHLNIKIVDSSHMAVELLKLNPDCHPVNVVKTSKDCLTAVDSLLNTLIIGFGEVGRDAFRFLYEFGAFVNSVDTNDRSPFECTIVDQNLDDIQGSFMASMPGIFKHNNGKYEENSIHFENVDYSSPEFFSSVLLKDKFLETVNYIIISIGNNDEAIALAARIFNQVRRVREDVTNLRIFVRVTDNNKVEGIQKIADHYNFGYGNGEDNIPVIQIFGHPEKTYTYDLVVSDRLIEEGKEFHEKYRVLSGEGDSWEERHKQLTETGTPNIEKLRKLRRQESQDRANALHSGTKLILLKKAMAQLNGQELMSSDWFSFYQNYFNADGTTDAEGSRSSITYPHLSTKENEIILRLAMLEHLRWNAAHELMGYVFFKGGTKCDERTMKHNCLCPWDKLDEQSDMITDWDCDYKKYDFCVVDTTISLNQETFLHSRTDD